MGGLSPEKDTTPEQQVGAMLWALAMTLGTVSLNAPESGILSKTVLVELAKMSFYGGNALIFTSLFIKRKG